MPVEPETTAGEYYLDTVSVFPNRQGRGIGNRLISSVIERAKESGHDCVGLLVEKANPSAKKLYQRLGFEVTNIKNFMGGEYEHMIRNI
jgi:ribosomal protein S18 acetylase RimI-like enzyme